jgi:Zn-finger nucleic acid-binding protein
MMRRYFSSTSKIEIDVCPQSGGIWLDAGELKKIREAYRDEKQRLEKGEAFVDQNLEDAGFKLMNANSTAEAQQMQNMTRVLRFLMPSSYLPRNIINLFFS